MSQVPNSIELGTWLFVCTLILKYEKMGHLSIWLFVKILLASKSLERKKEWRTVVFCFQS